MTDPDDFWHLDDGRSLTDRIVLAVAIALGGGLVSGVLFALWKVFA